MTYWQGESVFLNLVGEAVSTWWKKAEMPAKIANQSFQVEQKASQWHDRNKPEERSLMELSPDVSLHWLQSYDVLGKRGPGQLNFMNVIQCHSLLPPFETKQLYVTPQMVTLSFIVWSPL